MTLPDPVKVSRDLAEIIDLEAALLTQAVNLADAKVDGHSLPGGAAMISLAPVARLSRWTDRILEAERVWYENNPGAPMEKRPEFGADEDDSWEPALQTLRFWTDHYRRVLNMQYGLIPTLATEAAFLRAPSVLEWIFAHEPHIKEFRDDVNLARLRLENVVHAGKRTERTRIVCADCDHSPQLLKVYESRKPAAYGCAACGSLVGADDLDHCPNPWCWSVTAVPVQWKSDPSNDWWKCPSCKRKYDRDALSDAHAKQLRHDSMAKFVPWDQARATLVAQGRSDRTVRKWMAPQVVEVDVCTLCRRHWDYQEWPACPRKLKARNSMTGRMEESGETCGGLLVSQWKGDRDAVVEAYCEFATHRVMVWWPDLWRLHLSTQVRKRATA